MHDSLKVANRFLDHADATDDALTPMQLLKLVYIAHGWTLGLYGRPLIRDEVQAWQYGPVVPRLYNATRQFKSNPVRGPLPAQTDVRPLDVQEESVVEQVYRLYGQMSGPALSRVTHLKGSPWEQIYTPGVFGSVIPNDIIEDYYADRANLRPKM